MFRKFRRRAGSQTMIGIWIAILTLVLFSGDLRARYVDAIERAKATARNFAGVLAEDTALTFDMVTRTLREAEVIRQQMVLGKIGLEEANAALRSLRTSSPVIVAIGWSNPQGDIIAHSYDRPIPRPNISSMEHFVEQRDNPRDSVYIATPFRSAVGDKWFTAASLRLNNLDGSFAGALTAPIDQTYFSSLYRSMDQGPTARYCFCTGRDHFWRGSRNSPARLENPLRMDRFCQNTCQVRTPAPMKPSVSLTAFPVSRGTRPSEDYRWSSSSVMRGRMSWPRGIVT